MRAIFSSGKVKRTRERLKNDVAARLHRQQRLTDEESRLELVAIIDEAALRKKVGGAEVMREQLRHLADRAVLPTVIAQDPPVLYVEYPTGSLHVEKPGEVAETKLVFARLRSEALSPADIAFIERAADRLDRA